MSWRSIADAWNRVFFQPRSPAPLGLFRILFGLLVTAKLLLLFPDWLEWFGVHGWVTLDTMHELERGTRINLFDLLPEKDSWILWFFWIALLATICLTVGFLTRLSSVLVFFALTSIDERALYAMNSGDSFLRIASFLLIFAPAAEAFSIDRLIRIWRGSETPQHRPQQIWAQRMIQYLVALVYFVSAWWKAMGATWVDGTAIYYVHHLEQFRRFPLPLWLDHPVLIKLQTWFALAEEFALGTLIWIKEFRYWVLGLGVILHLSLEYSMNVPLFQWTMLFTFVLFVEPDHLARAWDWVGSKVGGRLGPAPRLTYDSNNFDSLRRVNLLRALDVFGKVVYVDAPEALSDFQTNKQTYKPFLLVHSSAGPLYGWAATRELAKVIPSLWVLRLLPARKSQQPSGQERFRNQSVR